ncbi:N-acetylglucosamine kinase [Bythopirellula polymerisocia]|uniref:Glucosamine kinase GspK n=1 Tax=Bythopirellula polymerisocia TaxID=2528003 RepID=A0A5C6CXZ0_9BACT|nr:BadF/BadG/BcrA/BcrD ATPase family protein [Bythopirellula polymerisocia]TWU28444.1 Glucosamine kinase GspK [Bythopirellula polymerisocia]
MSEQIVIGIDGGGTRLRAALVSVEGELLGIGEAGSGNYHDVGADEVRRNLDTAIQSAWSNSQLALRQANSIFLGLGSIVTQEDQETIRKIVRELSIVPEDAIGVDHDLRVALMGGLAGEAGIVLIAGTGSSCYGRDDQGNSWQAGGWGPILDDPGSSYWLGRQAMVAAIRDYDGRGESTCLRSRILVKLGLSAMHHILRRVELEGMTRTEIAALARLVTQSAAEGDSVACGILKRGAVELAAMVAAVVASLENLQSMQRIPVVVTGGLTNSGDVFLGPLTEALHCQMPQAKLTESLLPPVLGAALLAIELAGSSVTTKVSSRLVEAYSAKKEECAVN